MQPIQQSPTRITRSVIPVAIYTRVSTLHQVGGRFDSCESQAAICRDFIRKHAHEGWFEYACHTDAAYSGGTMNRPGLQALYRQIEAGEVKIVLIFKFERMLRNTDEWVPFRSFLTKHGCRLVSTTEDLSEETPSGRLKNNLLVSVAEYERLNTAEKVRAKLGELAKRGIWNCGLVPFGYNYDAAEKKLHPRLTTPAGAVAAEGAIICEAGKSSAGLALLRRKPS
jgi:DNA invertase Pin-like site-specific DNA recombinase